MTYTSVLLVYPLEHEYPAIEVESGAWHQADAIVVLACYYYEDNGLPYISRFPDCTLKRNTQAALMYEKQSTAIYVSGGKLSNFEHSLAFYNAEYLEILGVNKADITLSEHGYSTESEVKALKGLLKGKIVALVTSATHMIRAKAYFEAEEISVIPIPVDHLSRKEQSFMLGLPNAKSLLRSERAIHEYFGLLYQRFLR